MGHAEVVRTGIALAGLASGCNQVFGIDKTELAADGPRVLVFDNSASKADLLEFPVLVRLDATRVDYAAVASPATDLRFHDPDTDQDLAFEIERWDPAGESDVWVKVPQIDAGSTTDRILMYAGPDAGGQEQPAEVWSSFAFVDHAIPGRYRSTVGNFVGDVMGITASDGMVGSAMHLAGPGEHWVAYSNSDTLLDRWGKYTFELWLYADYADSNVGGEPEIVSNGGSFQLGRLFRPSDGIDPVFQFQIDTHFQNPAAFENGVAYPNPYVPVHTWIHMVFAFDGENILTYRNGALVDVFPGLASTALVGAGPLILGDSNDPMIGFLDEIRISDSVRDPDWVRAQYLSMTGRFVSISDPEASP